MNIKLLKRALERNEVAVYYPHIPKTVSKSAGSQVLCTAFRNELCKSIIIHPQDDIILGEGEGSNDPGLIQAMKDMIIAGVFHLPFSKTTFHMNCNFLLTNKGDIKWGLKPKVGDKEISGAVTAVVSEDTSPIYSPMGDYSCAYGDLSVRFLVNMEGRAIMFDLTFVFNPYNIDKGVAILNPNNVFDDTIFLKDSVAEWAGIVVRHHIAPTVWNTLILLATDEVEMVGSGKRNVELISRDKPEYSSYTIRVKKGAIKGYYDGDGNPRKKMRLHLRRGHIRHQKFGSDSTQMKIIWIKPMLIGYSEEGMIDHDYVV